MSDEIDRNDEIAMFMEISGKFSDTSAEEFAID